MKASIIFSLIFIFGIGSRAALYVAPIDEEGSDEEDLPVHKQLGDLKEQNFLTSIAEGRDQLEQDLHRLQQESSWEEEWASAAANGSAGNKIPAKPSLQTLLESYLKVHQLEILLNQTRKEADELRERAEQCEEKVDDLTGKVKNRTKEMEEQEDDIIRKLVRTYNRHRVWRTLRAGLEAVLDPKCAVYVQLQTVGYDQVNPLKKMSEESGWETLLDALLDAGLDADMVAGPNDWTMLHYATYSGHLNIAELLMKHDAHLEMRNDERKTPLVLMATHKKFEALRLLVERGAYVSSADKQGRSSLHYAATNDQLEMAKFLVNHGALTALKDTSNRTPRGLAGSNSVGQYLAQFEG